MDESQMFSPLSIPTQPFFLSHHSNSNDTNKFLSMERNQSTSFHPPQHDLDIKNPNNDNSSNSKYLPQSLLNNSIESRSPLPLPVPLSIHNQPPRRRLTPINNINQTIAPNTQVITNNNNDQSKEKSTPFDDLLNSIGVNSKPKSIKSLETTDYNNKEILKQTVSDHHQIVNQTFSFPPLDWTIHTKIRITSINSLIWTQELTGEHEAESLANNTLDLNITNMDPNSKTPFQIKHPINIAIADTTIKGGIDLSPVEKRNISFAHIRLDLWRDSFRSLFHLLDSSCIPYFYFFSSSFTILFSINTSTTLTTPTMTALINKSSLGFRQYLSDHGVVYSQPYSKKVQSNNNSNLNNDMMKLEKFQPGVVARTAIREEREEDNTPLSLVMIENRIYVYKLVDLLMNSERRIDELPSLYSSAPFLHSTVQRNTITKYSTQTNTSNYPQNGNSSFISSSLELSGLFLPLNIIRLCEILNAHQNGQYLMRLSGAEEERSTTNFNLLHQYYISSNIYTKKGHNIELTNISHCRKLKDKNEKGDEKYKETEVVMENKEKEKEKENEEEQENNIQRMRGQVGIEKRSDFSTTRSSFSVLYPFSVCMVEEIRCKEGAYEILTSSII